MKNNLTVKLDIICDALNLRFALIVDQTAVGLQRSDLKIDFNRAVLDHTDSVVGITLPSSSRVWSFATRQTFVFSTIERWPVDRHSRQRSLRSYLTFCRQP